MGFVAVILLGVLVAVVGWFLVAAGGPGVLTGGTLVMVGGAITSVGLIALLAVAGGGADSPIGVRGEVYAPQSWGNVTLGGAGHAHTDPKDPPP